MRNVLVSCSDDNELAPRSWEEYQERPKLSEWVHDFDIDGRVMLFASDPFAGESLSTGLASLTPFSTGVLSSNELTYFLELTFNGQDESVSSRLVDQTASPVNTKNLLVFEKIDTRSSEFDRAKRLGGEIELKVVDLDWLKAFQRVGVSQLQFENNQLYLSAATGLPRTLTTVNLEVYQGSRPASLNNSNNHLYYHGPVPAQNVTIEQKSDRTQLRLDLSFLVGHLLPSELYHFEVSVSPLGKLTEDGFKPVTGSGEAVQLEIVSSGIRKLNGPLVPIQSPSRPPVKLSSRDIRIDSKAQNACQSPTDLSCDGKDIAMKICKFRGYHYGVGEFTLTTVPEGERTQCFGPENKDVFCYSGSMGLCRTFASIACNANPELKTFKDTLSSALYHPLFSGFRFCDEAPSVDQASIFCQLKGFSKAVAWHSGPTAACINNTGRTCKGMAQCNGFDSITCSDITPEQEAYEF